MIEARRFLSRLPPRAWAISLLTMVVLAGAIQVMPSPGLPSDGLFVVDVDPESPFAIAAEDSRIRTGTDADATLGETMTVQNTVRGRATHVVLHARLQDHIDTLLQQEADQEAAFPLLVDVHYVSRDLVAPATNNQPTPQPDPQPAPSPATPQDATPPPERIAESQVDARPRDLEPPFPVQSLILTFAYILPAGLLVQLHGANLHSERTKGRARVLLSTPMSSAQILWSKSAPFLVGLLLIDIVVTLVLGAAWYAFAAAGAVLLLLLAITTFMAIWARSPREFGMLQVAATTMLNVFLFLPAMFPSIPPVAYLSPMHVVAQDMAGASIPFPAFAYAVLPTLLATIGLVALSIAFATEELWLGNGRRLAEAVRRASPGWKSLPAGLLVVPFVFVLQLTVLVSLTVLGLDVAIWFGLPASVLIEETAKGLVARGRSWRIGALAGAGFFIGEKTALLLTLVGFRDLPFGAEALALLGSGQGVLMLAAPLALHVITGILLTRRRYGFIAAVGVHFLYDRILLVVAA